MKTYVATPTDRQRDWLVVDAEGQTLGRLATRIAGRLATFAGPAPRPPDATGSEREPSTIHSA